MSDASIHPRDLVSLYRVEVQEAAFEAALSRGRLHHAWLLTGPAGVGKAAFAYRAARRLLGAQPDFRLGVLNTAPNDPVARLIAASSHPDLMVLERETEGGVTKRGISVEQARKLPGFFAKAPALGPYRVAIIDTADDLNATAANAVLKTLEEPSGGGVVFLISNAPGRLLPTIRSRCRRLVFDPWPREALIALLAGRPEASGSDLERLADEARGSPGRALAGGRSGALDEAASALLSRLPAIDPAGAQALADSFRGAGGNERFASLVQRLSARAKAAALAGGPDAGEGWATAWSRLNALPEMVEGLNLDRGDALWTVVAELRAATRASGLSC